MGYQRFEPRAELAGFVALMWAYQGDASAQGLERTLPTGSAGLIVNLRGNVIPRPDREDPERARMLPGSIVVGASSQYGVIARSAQSDVIGVEFRAGGSFPFFGCPAGDFQDDTVALEDVWGPAARELRDQLIDAPDMPSRVQVLETALLAQVRRPLERHSAVSYAVQELRRVPARLSVLELTDAVGLGAKRFTQVFREQVGLTPKLFGRVRRFQTVIEQVHGRSEVDWADVAVSVGYYDQAHFVHDFRGFTGLTPSAYLTRRGQFMNHVPLD